MTDLTVTKRSTRAAEAIAECRLLATFTEEPGRTTRRYLSPSVAQVHAHLRVRMEALGMAASVDAAGNLRGTWQPADATGKRFAIGSHIDTVPNAGAFDGVLGVVLALQLVAEAQANSIPLAIEVIAFSEEEGVRYGVPFLGSRAVAGVFDPALLALEDSAGVRMADAIRAFGLDPARINEAALEESVFGFLEIHIEQGPVLEAEDLQLAAVEGIAGQSRLEFHFSGQANHAGTTPMHLRRDALAAAAEWMTAVESAARQTEGLVATVGKVSVEPNACNVIPGAVDVSLDVRHMRDSIRGQWVREFIHTATEIAAARDLDVGWVEKMNEPTVGMDPELTSRLTTAVEAAGFPIRKMPSGAGHDAMIMASRVPSAMLFLRSPGGISHDPAEAVLEEDVEAALKVAVEFLLRLATLQIQ